MPITVNGVEISDHAVNVESAHYEGGDIRERQHQAAVALVVRELLRQRADELGLPAEQDEEARLDALLGEDAPVPVADEAACRAYYDKNRERFTTSPVIAARHILLPAHPDDLEQQDRQREVAERLIATLEDDREAFAALAREHSACPSRDEGGYLGQLERGSTVPELDEVLLRQPEGLCSRPLGSRYGWHVMEVLQRAEGRQLPYDSVRARIAEYLTERSRRRAVRQYIAVLAGAAEIEGIELESAESPLVQ